MENQFREKFAKMMASVKESEIEKPFLKEYSKTYSFEENGKHFDFKHIVQEIGDRQYGIVSIEQDKKETFLDDNISDFKLVYFFYRFLQYANSKTIQKYHGDNNAN